MAQPLRTRLSNRPVERRAQDTHLDEVIEMSGLERRILAVIRKAQKFGWNIFLRCLTQIANSRKAENRRRGAAPLRAERGQFAEIEALACVVGDTTMQAEAKWRGHKMACQAISFNTKTTLALPKRSIEVNAQSHRQGFPAISAHTICAFKFFNPIIRQALHQLLFIIIRPRILLAGVQKTGLALFLRLVI